MKRQTSNEEILEPKKSNHHEECNANLTTLPSEVFCLIAMRLGFRSAMTLRLTCKFAYKILADPYAWTKYNELSPDRIDSIVSICTKLHLFDHLVFGEFLGQEKVFFLHKTFLEHYDFLGGISFSVSRDGIVNVDFFEHKERLDCYQRDLRNRMSTGEIPPPLIVSAQVRQEQRIAIESVLREQNSNSGSNSTLSSLDEIFTPERRHLEDISGGLRVEHSCDECKHYDHMAITDSMFVYDQMDQDHIHTHLLPHGTISIRIKPDKKGYSSDLPMVMTHSPKIDGIPLTKNEYTFFRNKVQRR